MTAQSCGPGHITADGRLNPAGFCRNCRPLSMSTSFVFHLCLNRKDKKKKKKKGGGKGGEKTRMRKSRRIID
jgi:hypothetical protein